MIKYKLTLKQRIKRWLREKYIRLRFYFNEDKNCPVYLKSTDRQYGLTFMIEKKSLSEKIPILVPSEKHRKYMAHEMYILGQLMFAVPNTEKNIYNDLLVTPYVNNRGKRIHYILIDNSCRESDLDNFLENHPSTKIKNGFVTL